MSKSSSTDRATLAIFWRAGLENRRYLLLAVLSPVSSIFLSMLVPLYVGKILAALGRTGGKPSHYLPYFVGIAVAGLIFNRIGFASLLIWQARTMSKLQSMALDALLRRSVGFHNNNVGGKLVSDAIDYPNAFSLLVAALFANLIPLIIILLFGTALVFASSWILGFVVLAMTAYTFLSGLAGSRRRSPLRKVRLKATKAVTGHLADVVMNVQTVKTFAREHDELATHNKLNNELLTLRLRDWRLAALEGNNRITVLIALQLVLILTIVHLVQQRPQLLSIGIFAFSFTITLSLRLFDVSTMLRNIEDGFLQASPMTEILQQQAEIQDAPHAAALHVDKGAINLSTVHFRYEDSASSQPVFEELDLHIAAGEKIGLVGPSGGGKSTLTRLLLRFDDIESGAITIDGQNIAECTQASLRQAISYVPQEPLLFHRSVAENIAYGKPSATLAEIKQAAKAAHADEFIAGLPNAYDTIVGERGVKLSGGQRQRIAIARAILKDAPILILDEATSALDSESEVLIQDALWRLMQGRTAIVIAHRLSTIQKMDRIVVLDNGKIVEQGSHTQLLKQKGLYATLWAHQSGGFIEE